MKNLKIKYPILLVFSLMLSTFSFSQYAYFGNNKAAYHLAAILSRTEDSVIKQFQNKNLNWPPTSIYIRSFKYDRQLEVWVKTDSSNKFRLFKSYKICMQSGTMGPKRMEGDYQVPEGFYYINDFNANSTYHLSLGLNYPNPADKLLSDSMRPGGDIYIHGSCVTVGCIPIMDAQIEELYVLSTYAKAAGQEFIPVHIFPAKYGEKASAAYLEKFIETEPDLKDFENNLKKMYDFFEENKRLPVVAISDAGKYVFY
jgi:murein L,D-transpeptidase YafK